MARTASRTGRPALSLQTIIKRIRDNKKTAAAGLHDALDAAKTLEAVPKSRSAKYRDAGAVGGAMSPLVRAVGRATEGAALARPGGRLRGAIEGVRRTNRGELARHVTEGALGAGGVRAVQEGVEVGKAKRTIHSYLRSSEKTAALYRLKVAVARCKALEPRRTGKDKKAAIGPAKAPPKLRPLPPIASPDFDFEVKGAALATSLMSTSKNVGKFKGMATANSLKPPGMPAGRQAINPGLSIPNAMQRFKTQSPL
jgi:hypothetical protein